MVIGARFEEGFEEGEEIGGGTVFGFGFWDIGERLFI